MSTRQLNCQIFLSRSKRTSRPSWHIRSTSPNLISNLPSGRWSLSPNHITSQSAHIEDAHLIHDDLVIATSTIEEHLHVLNKVMLAISRAGLTLNVNKCKFCQRQIKFWGMIFGEFGVRPDPEKVDDRQYLSPSTSKQELISFLCMTQSNSDFIPQFSKKSAPLRDLTKVSASFQWLNSTNSALPT